MGNLTAEQVTVEAAELVQLAAVDNDLFCRSFFPKTARQEMPKFAHALWHHLEHPDHRLVAALMFRGSSKTTTLRMFAAKRIGYGTSRTILIIGKSQDKALESVGWIRTQIERNVIYRETFGLKIGPKWQDGRISIEHRAFDHPIWVLGMGITGSHRGINLDDYRPDLIIVDDVIDEENSATKEQREKIENLILGALVNSLAPRSEAPNSKLVMLQTPLHFDDASMKAVKDAERGGMWSALVQPCWTRETENLPLEHQESVWPERFSSDELRMRKQSMIAANKTSVWMREMECRLVSPETSAFRPEWIQYYDDISAPKSPTCIIAVDPVPPPSSREVEKGLHKKDYEAIVVVGFEKGKYYLMEYALNRGHDPSWSKMKFFELAWRWRCRRGIVESVAYQRTLKWLLEQEMQRQGRYLVMEDLTDRRKKYDRIVDAISGPAQQSALYVRPEHSEFINQFIYYPNIPHDDLLDAVAMAMSGLLTVDLFDDEYFEIEEERQYPALPEFRGAP